METKRNRGFTLVEILIVVVILGILAAIVIPQFSQASSDANLSSLKSNLQTIRSQIELFKIQHLDVPPAVATFEAQMTDFLYSKEEALERVRELMKDYEINYFGPASRWPGDRANEAIKYALKEGIPYSEGQIETLKRSAAYVGLDFNKMIQSMGKKHYPAEIFKK